MSASPEKVPELRIPDDLTEIDQWVMWRFETRAGTRTKVPCQISGEHASTTDSSTWASYERVVAASAAEPDNFAGIGFVFTPNDPFTGIDFDDCLQAGRLKPWAQPFAGLFADSYMEVSPSGEGLKLWVKAKLPGSGTKVLLDAKGNVLRDAKNPRTDARVDGGIEMYDQSRFFTVTGRAFNGAPLQIEDHQADVVALYQKLKGFAVVAKPKADIADQSPIVEGGRHEYLASIAAQFGARGMSSAEIFAATQSINQSRCEPPKSEIEVRDICDWVVKREQTKGQMPSRPAVAVRNPPSGSPDLLSFLQNDHGNSERVVKMFGSDLRYCYPLKKWLVWDGHRWAVDISEQSRRLAKETMLEYLRQAVAASFEAGIKFAKSSLDSKRITNALKEAQDQIFVQPSELDQHPYLLNFLNGTVDLRTGIRGQHRREDFITKLVHYDHNPAATCHRFMQFLGKVTLSPDAAEAGCARSERLIAYLQRALGYSLTGITSEKAVFLLHGPRDNGKSTLLATFLKLLDEYAVLLQIDTLMVKPGGENNNTQADLADLRSARFVMTSETEEGQRLAEGKLKRITQGIGRIKATRKYENPIEFDESHKLWIDANHLPVLRSHDDATWRRLHAIPFNVVIDKPDKKLSVKLLAEAEGILAWAVRGAVDWCSDGLRKPAEVEQTNSAWRKDMDQVGRFVDDYCLVGQGEVKANHLYSAYQKWAENGGEKAMSGKAFGERILESKRVKEGNVQKQEKSYGNVYVGMCLRENA